jgi:hypothetical protein
MHLKQAARHTRVVLAASVVLAAGAPAAAQAGPTFNTYVAPAPLGQDAGEPSIGVDRATGKVLYQAGLETERVDLDATPAPTWKNVGATLTSLTTLDPILATDARTNRTFVSQLAGACSLLAYTDDDGASFTQNPLGCGLASGADHQTIGGGPFATVLPQPGRRPDVQPRRPHLQRCAMRRTARPHQGRPGRHRLCPQCRLRRAPGLFRLQGQRHDVEREDHSAERFPGRV